MRIAPASAVPIDAPSWVPVFCRPPTSPLCSSGTADTVTLPSCEAIAPSPEPTSSSGPVMTSGPALMSSRRDQQDQPGEQQQESGVDHPSRVGVGQQLRDTGGEQQQRQRQRQQPHAGLHRRQPQRYRQEQRHHEERARLHEEHEQEREHPGSHLDVAQQLGVDERALPACDPPSLPAQEQREDDPAAQDQPDHRRQTDPLRGLRLGLHDAPRAGLQDPEDDHPQAERRQGVPKRSSLTPFSAGVSFTRRASTRITATISTSPAKTQRHEA